jgi:hypothetical protein
MGTFCYSTFARELSKAASVSGRFMTPLAMALIGSVVKKDNIKNEHGAPLTVNSSYARRWFQGAEDIPNVIVKEFDEPEAQNQALNGMNEFASDYLIQDKLKVVCAEMYLMVQSVPLIPSETNKKIKDEFDSADWVSFLTDSFLVSLRQKNGINAKKNTELLASLKETRMVVDYIKKTYGLPVHILVPEDPTDLELRYSEALREAYQEDANIHIISLKDLKTDPALSKYKTDFDRQRRYFYAAESLKEATRDTELFSDEKMSFENFKKEIRDKTREEFDAGHKNGYERMIAVTDKAAVVDLKTLLDSDLHWVTESAKRGAVHEWINDEGERWVKNGDK